MHTRKVFLVYKPEYHIGDGFTQYKSLFQAKKAAIKLGSGSLIDIVIRKYKSNNTHWISSSQTFLGEIT